MDDLWQGYFKGAAADVVTNHTLTCCTKWSPTDRHSTPYKEWRFEYDHVFVAGSVLAPGRHAATAQLIPYAYPGTAAPCADPACTGEDPPANKTATHQGSIHRGWLVDLPIGAYS